MTWSNFTGGSNSSSECIPDIPPLGIGFSGASQFYCSSGGYTVDVQFFGGVLPITWVTNMGKITSTGMRSATVKIHTAVGTPLVYSGYADVNSPLLHPACDDPLFAYASLRLGKNLLDKNPLTGNCRHHCDFVSFNCFDEYTGGDGICGDNAFVSAAFDCPFTFVQDEPGNPPYATYSGGIISSCLGGCVDATNVIFSYPEVNWLGTVTDTDYVACGNGLPEHPAIVSSTIAQYVANGSQLFDTRHPALLALGCSPCSLVQSLDVIVTAVDAAGNVVITDIHIN